jgi:hypothetical protein
MLIHPYIAKQLMAAREHDALEAGRERRRIREADERRKEPRGTLKSRQAVVASTHACAQCT